MAMSVVAVMAAIAVPAMGDLTDNMKITESVRLIERELQDARLRAVSSNRILRVRTNCPTTGFVRTVELLNTTVDTSTNRCSAQNYPYPAADDDMLTRPNYDGPVRAMPHDSVVGNYIIEFRPDGTSRNVVNNVAQDIASEITITVSRSYKSRSITVNGAGKILLQ